MSPGERGVHIPSGDTNPAVFGTTLIVLRCSPYLVGLYPVFDVMVSSELKQGPVSRLDWGEGQTRDVHMSSLRDEKGSFHVKASVQTMMREPF